MNDSSIKPWVRVSILIVFLFLILFISKFLNGVFIPSDPKEALIFQNALLLIILGSAIIEHKFTKPADSVVNSLIGLITLLTVKNFAPPIWWYIISSYCVMIFIISTTCVAVSTGKSLSNVRQKVVNYTYTPSIVLGKARLLFSIIFLFGVLSFYSLQSTQTVVLISFWGIYLAIWPLKIPNLLSSFFSKDNLNRLSIGHIIRTDWPNIIRVSLEPNIIWKRNSPKLFQQSDGEQKLVIPLYSQFKDNEQLGTGLCISSNSDPEKNLSNNLLYDSIDNNNFSDSDLAKLLGGNETSKLIGFVIEESTIAKICFETWDFENIQEGRLVWCDVGSNRIYFQITNGVTKEEPLESERHGYQVAIATQLGVFEKNYGFKKYEWLPSMNTPVFLESESFGDDLSLNIENDFNYGYIPKSKINISGSIIDNLDHHTAILGVTGSGKTELAFDIIRHSVNKKIKVLCIDLTSRYEGKLKDVDQVNLSISAELSKELSDKLFDVETGEYGAGKEKKALGQFAGKLREEVQKSVISFLTQKKEIFLGIINLEEISNTKATLFITELYMTCLLHFAKDNSDKCPRTLIVVEEAHTVMPEPSTMGLGDFDSKGLVSKISQIALQGRKYGVGLLVIAQRTATVSKTVLTQCNTMISFTCYDDTSLSFLKNMFSQEHIDLIPNLPKLQAVMFGKAVRSERPVVVEIPYDKEKAKG
jgi:Helicase HerA, central domain